MLMLNGGMGLEGWREDSFKLYRMEGKKHETPLQDNAVLYWYLHCNQLSFFMLTCQSEEK